MLGSARQQPDEPGGPPDAVTAAAAALRGDPVAVLPASAGVPVYGGSRPFYGGGGGGGGLFEGLLLGSVRSG